MFETIIDVFTRIAVALETIAHTIQPAEPEVVKGPADVPAGHPEVINTPVETAIPIVQPPVETATPIVQPPVETVEPVVTKKVQTPPAGNAVWDPTTEELQGSYRSKPKQAAITAKLEELGVKAAKSWSWAKKHAAIIEHVTQFGATAQMTWETFEAQIKVLAAAGHRDTLLNAVQLLEGHQVVAQPNVNPANYQKILDMITVPVETTPEPEVVTRSVDPVTLTVNRENPPLPATQPADYQPGVVVNTPELLASYARSVIAQGADPVAVNNAVAPIAAGITYVPAERVAEAVNLINAAVGAV